MNPARVRQIQVSPDRPLCGPAVVGRDDHYVEKRLGRVDRFADRLGRRRPVASIRQVHPLPVAASAESLVAFPAIPQPIANRDPAIAHEENSRPKTGPPRNPLRSFAPARCPPVTAARPCCQPCHPEHCLNSAWTVRMRTGACRDYWCRGLAGSHPHSVPECLEAIRALAWPR
jgi:hypothetical protein